MESIRNAATTAVSTASSYIYGSPQADSGTEPVSGQQGKGTAEDPYDGGNKEIENKETENHASTVTSGTSGNSGPTDPSTGADPASGQKLEQKHQGGDRPTEAPSGEQSDAVKESKDEGEEAIKKRDPNDHSGEPMHMHGGSEEEKVEKEEEKDHPGQEGGDRHGDKGSGEEWVKSSGLKADGGDFDAAKPGAGREADRLLQQKGITKDDRGAMIDKDGEPAHLPPTDHQEPSHSKVKTLDKIKEKLHIGKH